MVMKSLIETLEDGTLILTRRGLSVLSICFFHISILHHNSSSASSSSQTSLDSAQNYTNLNYDLCECMQILMQLCETVKHHLDKKTDGKGHIFSLIYLYKCVNSNIWISMCFSSTSIIFDGLLNQSFQSSKNLNYCYLPIFTFFTIIYRMYIKIQLEFLKNIKILS